LNPGAVFKWMVLRADRAEYTRQCEELAGSRPMDQDRTHKDAGIKRMQEDEAVVQRIAACVENWINPFHSDEQLYHLASGLVATEEVKADLLNAHDRGLKTLRTFAEERLEEDGTKDFYATLPQLQLKTFSSMGKNNRGSEAIQASVLKSTRDLFGRLLVIGQTRELSMEKLLSYPLGPLPLSIATPDGGPIKTVKATLLKALEEDAQPLTSIPSEAAWVVDAMAILQSTKTTINTTYSELASVVFNSITRSTPTNGRIDWVVVDTYPEAQGRRHGFKSGGDILRAKRAEFFF
jgi:hypothetical protein